MLSALPSSAWIHNACEATSFTQAARASAYTLNLAVDCLEKISVSFQRDADAILES